MHYADPGVKPFRGSVGSVGLTYPLLEIGRFSFAGRRGVEYSYDTVDAYYVENSGSHSYTHRLFGEVDLQGKVARSLFDYSARQTEPRAHGLAGFGRREASAIICAIGLGLP